MIYDVNMAVDMNVMVAAAERNENRAKPQTACPLVHPLPRRVPYPTKIPDTMTSKILRE